MSRVVVPAFLALALALGGSAQTAGAVLRLELVAIGLLVWSYSVPEVAARADRWLLYLAWMAAALVALQLVPLPSAFWSRLPGRDLVVHGDALLGLEAGWRPLSLMPDRTIADLMFWTIPLAIVAASLKRPTPSRTTIAGVIVVAGLLGSLAGLAQMMGQLPHFFAFSSTGPTGQFANTNHLAALALASVPMIGALASRTGARSADGSMRFLGLTAALFLVVTVVLTNSLAIVVLIVPVAGLTLLIAVNGLGAKRWVLGTFAVLIVLGAGLLLAGGIGFEGAGVSASTRAEIWRHSVALSPYMVTGSGFGTFETLYHLVEDPFSVDRFYVNHAHNDLLELAIEGGIPALLLLIAFLLWFARQCMSVWRRKVDPDPFARAATVVIAILLVHSLVDFPLRTAAHLALAAACASMLVTGRPDEPALSKGDLRPTRHRRVA